MALASSSLVQLRYIQEATPGTTPNAGNAINLRLTGESLNFNVQTETSKEIRSDRQTTDLVAVGASCEGGFNFELSPVEYDPLISGVLQGDWVDVFPSGVSDALTLTITSNAATGGVLVVTDQPAIDSLVARVVPGQWLRLDAPDDPADNTYLRIKAIGEGGEVVVDPATPIPGTGTRIVYNCTLSGSRCANGVHQRFFTLEKNFSDIERFMAFRGMSPSKMSMSFETGSIVNGSLEFIGMTASDMQDESSLPGTPVDSATYDVTNSVTGVGQLMGGGINMSETYVQSLSIDIDNALRGQNAIGHFGFVGVASGTLAVTGTMQVYLKDSQAYDTFINNRAASLTWHVVDGDNNGYVFTLPKIKYSGGKAVAGAINQDVVLEMPFTALMDSITRKTIFVDRLYAPDVPRYPPSNVEIEVGSDNGLIIRWYAPHCDLLLSNDEQNPVEGIVLPPLRLVAPGCLLRAGNVDPMASAEIPPFRLTAPEITWTDGADLQTLDAGGAIGFMLDAPRCEISST